MGIYGAMYAGVAALQANSAALGMISDNIANVNTVAYKKNSAQFQTLVTGSSASNDFSPGGVRASSRTLMDQQGLLQGTESATDIAISGNGFFVVSTSPTTGSATDRILFTRAGSFVKDSDGNLRNTGGFYLQGWPVAADGTVQANPSDLTQLQTINLDKLGGTAEATTEMTLNANLDADTPISAAEATYNPAVAGTSMAQYAVSGGASGVQPDFTRSIQLFDSKGGFRTMTISMLKSSTPNQWHTELHVEPASDVVTGAGLINGQVATGTIAFTANGLLDTAATSPALLNLSFLGSGTAPGAGQAAWATSLGIAGQTVNLNLGAPGAAGGFTQFSSASNLISSSVNGAVFGNLSGVRINKSGFITALFDNGIERQIYQIPVATFVNPAGLAAESGNAFSVTDESGSFNLKIAGTGGAGTTEGAVLESSTVDLAQEFTGLITTQRAYSASTKIITTADDMLNELIQIKR